MTARISDPIQWLKALSVLVADRDPAADRPGEWRLSIEQAGPFNHWHARIYAPGDLVPLATEEDLTDFQTREEAEAAAGKVWARYFSRGVDVRAERARDAASRREEDMAALHVRRKRLTEMDGKSQ